MTTSCALLVAPSTSSAPVVVVADHLPLVHKVARRIARRLPRAVELDDLVAAGTIGLLDAARRFDPARVASFPQYAEVRVRGAILDHLRDMDWLSRTQRAETRRAAESGASTGAVTAVVSVEDVRDDGFDGFACDDAFACTPVGALESREMKARLMTAIATLPERTRQLLSLYYVDELTLKEIGAIFGVTESRACQLHGQAVQKLRAKLADA